MRGRMPAAQAMRDSSATGGQTGGLFRAFGLVGLQRLVTGSGSGLKITHPAFVPMRRATAAASCRADFEL